MAKSGAGMSWPSTKLGQGGPRFGSSLEALANVSPEEAEAVLQNTNTKIFLKMDPSATS